jgi:hypothetical protein
MCPVGAALVGMVVPGQRSEIISSLSYVYAETYRVHTRKYDDRYDKAVDKGLAQIAREERLSFPQLCAKLQHEAEVVARRQRRHWLLTPLQHHATETEQARYTDSVASYWRDRLTPPTP